MSSGFTWIGFDLELYYNGIKTHYYFAYIFRRYDFDACHTGFLENQLYKNQTISYRHSQGFLLNKNLTSTLLGSKVC